MDKSDEDTYVIENLIKILPKSLQYCDGFTHPKEIKQVSHNEICIVPTGRTIEGEIRFYLKVNEKRIELTTDPLFPKIDIKHPLFNKIKEICRKRNIGIKRKNNHFILFFKYKVKNAKDVLDFNTRLYDLGVVLEEANVEYSKCKDIVEGRYNQRFIKIGPYEIPILLIDKDVRKIKKDIFLPSVPGSLDVATLPDKSGFMLLQQGNILIGATARIAHKNIPPLIFISASQNNEFDALVPREIEKDNNNLVNKYNDNVISWVELESISKIIEGIIKLLQKTLEKEKLSDNPRDKEFIKNLIEKLKTKYSKKELFQSLINNFDGAGFTSSLDDIVRYSFMLDFDMEAGEMVWNEFSFFPINKYLSKSEDQKFRELSLKLWKLNREIKRGLEWARYITKSIVLWLGSQNPRLAFEKEVLEKTNKMGVVHKGQSISGIDLVQNQEALQYLLKYFESVRFRCTKCEKESATLLMHKSKQGPLFSCSECGAKYVKPELKVTSTLTNNMFVVDTSALIEGLPTYLVEQGTFDDMVFIISKATELELQRMVKGQNRDEIKKKGKKGLKELEDLKKLDDKGVVKLHIDPTYPPKSEIYLSKEQHIGYDQTIINCAKKYSAFLITTDNEDMKQLAVANGINVILFKK